MNAGSRSFARSTIRSPLPLSKLLVTIAFAACLLSGTLLPARAGESTEIVVQTRDGPRTALVLPARPGPQPTVIVLHGATMTAESTVRVSGFAEAAARYGFTAVFPQGLRRQWNDERSGGPGGPDDVAFLTGLVDRLVGDDIAQRGHVYIAGISNGGMMSFTLACQAGRLFRGIGTVIANMPEGLKPCDLPPLPLVMVNGTADPLVPYEGGSVGFLRARGEVWSVMRTAELFVHRNGCKDRTERPVATRRSGGATTATEISWSSCATGKPVVLYRIDGGGHQIAGEPAFLPRLLGDGNRDVSAADVILRMFANEERAGAQL